MSRSRIHRDDQRESREDSPCHPVGRILRVAFTTVHLTMMINVMLLEHDLLTTLWKAFWNAIQEFTWHPIPAHAHAPQKWGARCYEKMGGGHAYNARNA